MAGVPGPNVIRVCKRCGEEYHPKSTRQQCCNKPIKVPCVVCGRLMDQICTFSRQNTTCSKECSTTLANQNREASAQKLTRTCKWCGKEFHPKTIRDFYCEGPHYATCEVCGKQFEIIGRIDTHNKTCSDECRYISAQRNTDTKAMQANLKATMLERYGVENAMQIPGAADKIKATTKERYGSEWYTQTQEYREKTKQTCIEKYGVEHHLASPEIIRKRQQTFRKKYGVDNVFQSDAIKAKIQDTNLAKYGVDSPSKSPEIQEKIKQHNIKKYGVEHPMMLPEYQEKAKQTNFEKFGYAAPTQSHIKNISTWYEFINDPKSYIALHYSELPRTEQLANDLGVDRSTVDDYIRRNHAADCVRRSRSLMEEEIVAYIRSTSPGCKVITNDHRVLNGKELDIYLPEYSFAIECDPTVTHNSSIPDPWGGDRKPRNYHKYKTDECDRQSIFLMHIFGYDWTMHKDIMKSMISNILGVNRKIYARKCTLVEVPWAEAQDFLNRNHRQGAASSSAYLGLQYEGRLVSLMSFGKMRSTIGIDSSDLSNCWELVRFCSECGTTIIGGASRLFKGFITRYNPTRIRSFSDRAHTRGSLYATLGFTEVRRSTPNYVWVNVVTDIAYHRTNTQKRKLKNFLKEDSLDLSQTEKQIMESHGYVQVFDSGTITWEWRA